MENARVYQHINHANRKLIIKKANSVLCVKDKLKVNIALDIFE